MSVGAGGREEEEASATCYCAHSIIPSDLPGKSKILNRRRNATHLVVIPIRHNKILMNTHSQYMRK